MKWSEEKQPNDDCRYNHVETVCPMLGTIRITWKEWKSSWFDCIIINNDGNVIINAYEPNLESAKKSVETQYKELVRKITECNFESDKHIELVKKWLADPDSVTQKELEENAKAAEAEKAAYCALSNSANSTYRAVTEAATWAAAGYVEDNVELAKHWVERYEELNN